ncbi:hypothetical protein OUZ56_013926 [Daphnia magna]|uniref:Uncharacterized protein n=1 Tax=Daphnia magna TaxID=35525 RepID=A0ABQ9Z7C3_9CRUS|nr:hypothetical protein OUZ56_013926 [Daphnia magna]
MVSIEAVSKKNPTEVGNNLACSTVHACIVTSTASAVSFDSEFDWCVSAVPFLSRRANTYTLVVY